jgi:hypothetical protein
MKNVERVRFHTLETIKDDFYLRPEDELDEFSEFEMSLKLFCFEHNHSVLIELGDQKIQLHLYHDILDALEQQWCSKILELSAGSKASIIFNDFSLKITPIIEQNLAACEFKTFGTEKDHCCTVYLSDILETMHTFIDEVLGMAVKEGYINEEDIAQHLGWQLNSDR